MTNDTTPWVIDGPKAKNGHETRLITIDNINDWLDKKAKSHSSTATRYRASLRDYLDWLWKERDCQHPETATRTTIEDYIHHRIDEGYSHSTLDVDFSALSMLYDHYIDKGVYDEDDDPFWRLTRGKVGIKQETLKDDVLDYGMYAMPASEYRRILDEVPTNSEIPYKLIYKIMWSSGLRADEIERAQLKHIQSDRKRIYIPAGKTTTVGHAYIPNHLWPDFHLWYEVDRKAMSHLDDASEKEKDAPNNFIFPNTDGGRISTSRLSSVWRDAAIDADVNESIAEDKNGNPRWKITGHCIRPSYAVQSYRNGMSFADIQKSLRHKDPQMTSKYLALVDEDIEEAVRSKGAGHNPRTNRASDTDR